MVVEVSQCGQMDSVLIARYDLMIGLICPQCGVCLHGCDAQKQGHQKGCEAHYEGLDTADHGVVIVGGAGAWEVVMIGG